MRFTARLTTLSGVFFLSLFITGVSHAQLIPVPGLDTSKKQQTDSTIRPPQPVDTTINTLLSSIETYTLNLNKDMGMLRRGFDTLEIHRELPLMERILGQLSGNLESSRTVPNLRNLYSSQVALLQIDKQLSEFQKKLEDYSIQLGAISADLKAVRLVTTFNAVPDDSLLLESYYEQMKPVLEKKQLVDSLQKTAIRKVRMLQNRVAMAHLTSTDLLDDVNSRIRLYQSRYFRRDMPDLWNPDTRSSDKSISELINDGFNRNRRVLDFYITMNRAPFVVLVICALAFFLLSRYSMSRLKKSGVKGWEDPVHFLRRSSFGSAALLLFTLTPFVLRNPPAGIVQLYWLLMMITVTVMRWADWTPRFRKFWFIIIAFFLLYGLDSFLLEASHRERIILLLLNLAAIVPGILMYKEVLRDKKRYHSLMDESIILFVVINVFALVMNISGRFTFAKVLSNSSALSIVLLLSLQISKDIILEFLYLLIESNRNSRFYSYLEFSKIRDSFKTALAVTIFVIWILAFAWSMNFYDLILENISGILTKPRSLGEFHFTFSSILIFIAVIWVAMLIARLITFLFTAEKSTTASPKRNVGSWILLVRLGIFAAGFLLAIAAAGIPMDKLTIVIGALGVGIGFGLQTIVNNLISGIILAFEKPIQVGDIIDIGTRTGVVKEIGIRSSKISTFEGSDVIVPNGDLLSQQLVNWTHENQHRRIDLLIGVAYGSDLNKAETIIRSAMEGKEGLMNFPEPLIMIHNFSASSVDFRVLFWASEIGQAGPLKSEVLASIYNGFHENGIEIPFPQTDLHIRSIDEKAVEALKKGGELGGS